MFRERIIVDDSLVRDEHGVSVRARIPWYRALPLSCLVDVDLLIDGQPAPRDAITVEVDGVARSLAEAALAWDSSWYVLDDLVIRVAGFQPGDRDAHEVDLTLGIRIPYLPLKGEPLTIREHYSKTMIAKEVAV